MFFELGGGFNVKYLSMCGSRSFRGRSVVEDVRASATKTTSMFC